MRRVTNEQLATAITVQRMQQSPYLVQRLGRSRTTGMSPVRRFQGLSYYVFGDGSSEHLVVSPSEDQLYGPLLGLRLGDPRVTAPGTLRLGIVACGDQAQILSADLVFGVPGTGSGPRCAPASSSWT